MPEWREICTSPMRGMGGVIWGVDKGCYAAKYESLLIRVFAVYVCMSSPCAPV